MKDEKFTKIGMNEREANRQLAWTLSWGFLMLMLAVIAVAQP